MGWDAFIGAWAAPPVPLYPVCPHFFRTRYHRRCLALLLLHAPPPIFPSNACLPGSWMWRWISGVGCQQGGTAVSPRLPTSGGWFNPRPMNRIPPPAAAPRAPSPPEPHDSSPQEKDTDLPVCSPFSVCSKVDTYGAPFLEKQCRCPGSPCSSSMHTRDGHTIHDRTKQFKVRKDLKDLKI